jgi:Fe2+ transport system protein FeoA
VLTGTVAWIRLGSIIENHSQQGRPTLRFVHDSTVLCLADCAIRETVELVHIELPEEEAESLLERGVIPGCSLCAMRRSPAGDPIVAVDGMLLAMRREMAGCLYVRRRVADAA